MKITPNVWFSKYRIIIALTNSQPEQGANSLTNLKIVNAVDKLIFM